MSSVTTEYIIIIIIKLYTRVARDNRANYRLKRVRSN